MLQTLEKKSRWVESDIHKKITIPAQSKDLSRFLDTSADTVPDMDTENFFALFFCFILQMTRLILLPLIYKKQKCYW